MFTSGMEREASEHWTRLRRTLDEKRSNITAQRYKLLNPLPLGGGLSETSFPAAPKRERVMERYAA